MPGASSKMTIRGSRSFTGDNTPLYVVDGMPITSSSDINTYNSVTGADYANRAVDIDPSDIESINILKGQAASALYGMRATNGVIVITTKSGKGARKGKPEITVNTGFSFETPSTLPKFQKEYAQGIGGKYVATDSRSWGPKIADLANDPKYGGNTDNDYTKESGRKPGQYYVVQRARAGLDPWATPQTYDNAREFFNTGVTWNNSVNVAQNMDKGSYGWMAILNHEQKFSKDWKAFLNAGFLKNKLNKNVMYRYSALVIKNDAGDFDLQEQTTTTPQRANYIQMGVSGKLRAGKTEHDLTLAVDRAWRAREAAKSGGTVYNLGTGNIYTGIINQHTAPTTAYEEAMNNKTSIKGISLVDTITINKWDVLLGVHHHSANVKAYNLSTGRVSSSVDSSATTPTVALTYRPTKDTSVYVSHAEYFDVGSVVGASYKNRGEILPPAKTKQNEIGVKYANKDVLYTLAFFDITQANNIEVMRGADKYQLQDGEERHRGVELGVTGKIAPKWSLAAGLSYLRATSEKTKGGTNDGRTIDGQPNWNGALMVRYASDEKFSAFGRLS